MEEVKKKVAVSLSEVKELLKNQDPENMDQIQRWTFDYVSKVSTLEADSAKKMKQQLVKDCNITEEEAVELIKVAVGGDGKDPIQYLIAKEYLKTLESLGQGTDNKTVFLPYEATGVLSSLGGIKELLK